MKILILPFLFCFGINNLSKNNIAFTEKSSKQIDLVQIGLTIPDAPDDWIEGSPNEKNAKEGSDILLSLEQTKKIDGQISIYELPLNSFNFIKIKKEMSLEVYKMSLWAIEKDMEKGKGFLLLPTQKMTSSPIVKGKKKIGNLTFDFFSLKSKIVSESSVRDYTTNEYFIYKNKHLFLVKIAAYNEAALPMIAAWENAVVKK